MSLMLLEKIHQKALFYMERIVAKSIDNRHRGEKISKITNVDVLSVISLL